MRRRPLKIVRTDREPNMPVVIDTKLREAGHDLVLPPQDASEDGPLGAARRFKGIVKFGVGIAAIDRGVPVVNVPEYAGETVAEGAFALMIAPAKKLQPLGRAMREEGRVRPEPRWLGGDIAGRKVGLVGFGRIARNMARMCGAGFRVRASAYDPGNPAGDIAGGDRERRDRRSGSRCVQPGAAGARGASAQRAFRAPGCDIVAASDVLHRGGDGAPRTGDAGTLPRNTGARAGAGEIRRSTASGASPAA